MSNKISLDLYIPEPRARPGDAPDFPHIRVPEAGATRRPDSVDAEAAMRDLPFGLVRVLDEGGYAIGPWNPRLGRDTLRRGLRAMLRTRAFDERMFRSHRQGKTSFYMKSTGEEAIAVAQSMLLGGDD